MDPPSRRPNKPETTGPEQLAAKSVVGLVRPANLASRRVLERAGFLQEREIQLVIWN
jgi:RimJ/RimL family protein N-acetyltransferase